MGVLIPPGLKYLHPDFSIPGRKPVGPVGIEPGRRVGYINFKGDAPYGVIGGGPIDWTRQDLFPDGLYSTRFGSATKIRDTSTIKNFRVDSTLGPRGFVSFQGDLSGVAKTTFAFMSCRYNSGPNTLIWTTNGGSTVNIRINGGTVTLTPSEAIATGGSKSVVFYWDDASNERGIIVDGIVEDTSSTAFTWAQVSPYQCSIWHDTSLGEPEDGLVSSSFFGEFNCASELVQLSKDPYQVLVPFSPFIYLVPAAEGGLVVQGLSQDQFIGSPTLTQANNLAVNPVVTEQFISQSGFVQRHQLSVNGAAQAQTISEPVLTQAHVLAVNSASQVQAITEPSFTQAHQLAVDGISQDQTVDNVILSVAGALAVDSLSQIQEVENVVLSVQGVLNVAGLDQLQELGVPGFIQHNQLSVDGVSQDQLLEVVTFIQHNILQLQGLFQGQDLGNVTLDFQDILRVDGLDQVQVIESPQFTQHNVLSVDSLTQDQIIEIVTFGGAVIGYLEGHIVMYSLIDGEITMSELLTGSISIN